MPVTTNLAVNKLFVNLWHRLLVAVLTLKYQSTEFTMCTKLLCFELSAYHIKHSDRHTYHNQYRITAVGNGFSSSTSHQHPRPSQVSSLCLCQRIKSQIIRILQVFEHIKKFITEYAHFYMQASTLRLSVTRHSQSYYCLVVGKLMLTEIWFRCNDKVSQLISVFPCSSIMPWIE